MTTQTIIDYPYRQGSPCKKCLVKSTCSKSFVQETACEAYTKFIKSLIKKSVEKYKYENQN
jgi:hypothetical protein